ncbi:EamA family transporter RarD [Pandoraea terrae]|nr:EamA family transporter RarD [Pandoraea terrae]
MLSGRGVMLSVSASVMFSVMPAIVAQLAPLTGLDVFAWRILLTLPGTLVLLTVLGRWPVFARVLARVLRAPKLMAGVLACAALLSAQLWLFVWAPLQQRVLDVSLGYFLLPLSMVLVGRFVYGERLHALQWSALAIAAIGVAHELWLTRAISWVTALIVLGYPPYFMLRRWLRFDALAGFVLELICIAPFAIWALWGGPGADPALLAQPRFWLWLPVLGLLSATAIAGNLGASRLLPLGLFGIFGYVEPVLLFAVSIVVLGEPFSAQGLWTHGPIWVAVALVVSDSLLTLRRQAMLR